MRVISSLSVSRPLHSRVASRAFDSLSSCESCFAFASSRACSSLYVSHHESRREASFALPSRFACFRAAIESICESSTLTIFESLSARRYHTRPAIESLCESSTLTMFGISLPARRYYTARLVAHGHLLEWTVCTGAGTVVSCISVPPRGSLHAALSCCGSPCMA